MAGRKHNKRQYEAILAEISRLYLQNLPRYKIAELTSRHPSQISRDLRALEKRWKEEQLFNLDSVKVRQLASINEVERNAWQAWNESTGEHQTVTENQGNRGHFVMVRKETRAGDPRFLAIVLDCIKRRCDLLGLDAPKQIEGNFVYNFDFSGATDEQFADLGSRLDSYLT